MKQFIESTGLSERAFSIKIGISQKTLNNQSSGQRKLSVEVAAAVARQYKNLSLLWLLTGEGEMILENSNNKLITDLARIVADKELEISQLKEQINKMK